MNRRTCRAALPALLALMMLRLPAGAETPAAYGNALAQVQAAVSRQAAMLRRGTDVPAAQAPVTVAARALVPIASVERPGGPPAPVDASLLLAAIKNAEAQRDPVGRADALQAAAAQIAVLRRDVAAVPTPGARATQAETDLRAVLAGKAYGYDPLPPPSLFDRFTGWLERMLNRLFHRSAPRPDPAMPAISLGFVRTLAILLGAGAFALLVAVLVRWLRHRPARPQPLALDETEAALVEARDTDSLRALAEQKAQQGDYRLALRFVYLALLVALDTNGVLRFDRSKTNWEYLRALRAEGRADVYDAMTPLTRDFDRVWYGFARADADDYARALAHYDALQAAPAASRPTAAV